MIKEMATKARENRLIPEYTQKFFKRVFIKAGGKVREVKSYNNTLAIDYVPYSIRSVEDEEFKRRFGSILSRYPRITFDKEVAKKNSDIEFVSFGHPLFEAVMAWVEKNLYNTLSKGSCFLDPGGRLDGYMLFYEGEIKDGFNNIAGKRLFSYYISKDLGIIDKVAPSIIWDLVEGSADDNDSVDIEVLKKKVSSAIIKELEVYRDEIGKERERQADIKSKYGIASLEQLIVKLDGELIKYYSKKERGEDVDIVIRKIESRKNRYENALEDLKKSIEKEKSLTMSYPSFITAIRVKPMVDIDDSMRNDEEVER